MRSRSLHRCERAFLHLDCYPFGPRNINCLAAAPLESHFATYTEIVSTRSKGLPGRHSDSWNLLRCWTSSKSPNKCKPLRICAEAATHYVKAYVLLDTCFIALEATLRLRKSRQWHIACCFPASGVIRKWCIAQSRPKCSLLLQCLKAIITLLHSILHFQYSCRTYPATSTQLDGLY